MRTLFYLLLSGILFVGCATTETGNLVLKEKTKEEIQKSIVKNKSTKEDVLKIYGDPDSKDLLPDGGEKWFYLYTYAQDTPENYIPFMSSVKSEYKGQTKTLLVLFNKKGIVVNFDVSVKDNTLKGGINGQTYQSTEKK